MAASQAATSGRVTPSLRPQLDITSLVERYFNLRTLPDCHTWWASSGDSTTMKLLLPTFCVAVCFVSLSVHGQEGLSQLEASTRSLIEAFNSRDAEAVSSLFVERGELVLASGELILGREGLKKHYESLFEEGAEIKAALEVGSIRFLTENLAVQDGTVHFTAPDGEISSSFYQAIHSRQDDGSWLFASIRDVEGEQALPSEKLKALEWMIGDWVVQSGESNTWISVLWSGDGPYIDLRALTESPDGPSTAATMRIGWNEKDETIVSWAFDAEGGFNQSTWTPVGSGQWLLRTEGITASGLSNSLTQQLSRSPSGEGFSWSKRDQVIGGQLEEPVTLEVVKRPPQPAEDDGEVEETEK